MAIPTPARQLEIKAKLKAAPKYRYRDVVNVTLTVNGALFDALQEYCTNRAMAPTAVLTDAVQRVCEEARRMNEKDKPNR